MFVGPFIVGSSDEPSSLRDWAMRIGWFIVSPFTVFMLARLSLFAELFSKLPVMCFFLLSLRDVLYSWAVGRYRMVISGRGFLILISRSTCFGSWQPRSPASSAFQCIGKLFLTPRIFRGFGGVRRNGSCSPRPRGWGLFFCQSQHDSHRHFHHLRVSLPGNLFLPLRWDEGHMRRDGLFLHLLRARYSVRVSHTWQHLLRSVPVHAGSRGQGFPFPRSLALGVQSAFVRYSQDCTGRSTQSLSTRLNVWRVLGQATRVVSIVFYLLVHAGGLRFWSQVLSFAGREEFIFVESAVGRMSSLTMSSRWLLSM